MGYSFAIVDRQREFLRQLTLVGFLMIPLWGLVMEWLEPESVEIWWVRSVIAFGFLGLWWFSKPFQFELSTFEWWVAVLTVSLLTYLFTLAYEHGLHPTWMMGVVLVTVSILNFLTLKGPMALVLFCVLCLGVGIFFAPNPTAEPGAHLMNLLSAAFVGVYSSYQRNQFLNHTSEIEAHQNTILSSMHEGVLLLGAEGKILAMNASALTLVRGPAKSIENFDELQWNLLTEGGEELKSGEHPFEVAKKTGREVRHAFMRDVKGRWFDVSAVPVEIQKGIQGFLVTFLDITALLEAQKIIEEQRASLILSSRLAALGEMAAGIAHEINNPLAIILTRTETLARRLRDGKLTFEEKVEGLEKIKGTTHRIAKIVASMKMLSRQKEGDGFQTAKLTAILGDVLEVSREKLRQADVELKMNLPEGLEIECHASQIGQVFINLLSNSVDAIENLNKKWIEIEGVVRGERLVIRVTDSGSGIPGPVAEKLMQPFFTTKEVGKGTGLGLSLIRNIVNFHGGEFFLDRSWKNTRFVIELPLKQKSSVV